jgi:hypothetical protein
MKRKSPVQVPEQEPASTSVPGLAPALFADKDAAG